MKTPKFTDSHRFQRAYRPAVATDITRTFDAARKEMSKPPVRSNVRDLSEMFKGPKRG